VSTSPRILTLLSVCALWLTTCAINPATGKRQFVLISERQEIEIGRENDRAITSQMGLYDDDALQEYVQTLGRKLASLSERPDLAWNFKVVDDPVVNAFALPGGYIYVTRGILAHLNNEAELVAILGHEIGHVTARHSVSQMSKAQLAQLGLGVAAVAAPDETQQFGGLLSSGVGLLFLKYGRDDERQADDLGLRYISAAGYDARPMADVFDMLERVSQAAGGGGVPGWMATHPAPANRRARATEQLAATGQDFAGRPVGREEFLRRIDGITFGEDPRAGYFQNNLFYHPEMRFRLDFPRGWKLRNQRQAVLGITEEQDALVLLTLAREETAGAGLEKFFSQEGVTRTGPAMGSIGGLPTAGDGFTVTSEQGALEGRVGFVEHRGQVFRLLGYSELSSWTGHQSAIRTALASFRELTDRRALDVRPKRLEVIAVTRSTSLEEFAGANEATVPSATLALINRLDPDALLQRGRTYKLVTGGSLP
jgi:predicted Zn-dependent protease